MCVENKWQEIFEKNKIFQSEPDERKKFFVTFPYPYINASPHIGHSYTAIRNDMLAKYYRLKNYNILFPIGFHATGAPIVGASKRIQKGDEKQIKAFKLSGVADKDIKEFENPENIVKYFAKIWKEDFKKLGLSTDWRRTFITTSLNKAYDSFIKWQFNKLKKKGLIVKGNHPIVYCPTDKGATLSHDRLEGEFATIQKYHLLKYEFEPKKYLITATLRTETIFGAVSLWIKPNTQYVWIKVKDEQWLISEDLEKEFIYQFEAKKTNKKINSTKIIGKKVKNTYTKKVLPILPATFVKTNNGTGIVTNEPTNSPIDYISLKELHNQKKYLEVKPIEIIKTKYGNKISEYFINELKIKNQHSKKLEQATKKSYKIGVDTGLMLKNCGKYSGMKVKKARELIEKELEKNNHAIIYYETSETVVCRCNTKCYVSKIKGQWFIDYSNIEWKNKVLKHYNEMNFFPKETKNWMTEVTKIMDMKACARKKGGLGTRLPWDKEWIIEALSDSTIYQSFYIIQKFIFEKQINHTNLLPEFFNYVFLNKGKLEEVSKKTKLEQDLLKQIRKEFDYYYPVDLRTTGKDLLSHHMIFYIYNHIAIFPKKYWPKSVGGNGWVTVDGIKMSKSKGNFIPLKNIINDYGTDASRLTLLDSAEGLADPDFDKKKAMNTKKKLENILEKFNKFYLNSDERILNKDDEILLTKLNISITNSEKNFKKMENRQAIFNNYHYLNSAFNNYLKKTTPKRTVLIEFIKKYSIINFPIIPHYTNEYYSIVSKEFLFNQKWPEVDVGKINKKIVFSEKIIDTIIQDVKKIKTLTNIKPKIVKIIISSQENNDFFQELKKSLKKNNEIKTVINSLKNTPTKEQINTIVEIVKNRSKLPKDILKEIEEKKIILENEDYIKKEIGCQNLELLMSNQTQNPKKFKARPLKPSIILEK